jgi:hypothetical protein
MNFNDFNSNNSLYSLKSSGHEDEMCVVMMMGLVAYSRARQRHYLTKEAYPEPENSA